MNLFMDNEILFVDAKSRINVCKGGDELNLVGMEIAKQNIASNQTNNHTKGVYFVLHNLLHGCDTVVRFVHILGSSRSSCGTERCSQRILFCCKVELALMCLWICYESLF